MADLDRFISDMIEKRRKWLASTERTIELLQPEMDRFEASEPYDAYVARLYTDHADQARTYRKEIAALEAALLPAALSTPSVTQPSGGEG